MKRASIVFCTEMTKKWGSNHKTYFCEVDPGCLCSGCPGAAHKLWAWIPARGPLRPPVPSPRDPCLLLACHKADPGSSRGPRPFQPDLSPVGQVLTSCPDTSKPFGEMTLHLLRERGVTAALCGVMSALPGQGTPTGRAPEALSCACAGSTWAGLSVSRELCFLLSIFEVLFPLISLSRRPE